MTGRTIAGERIVFCRRPDGILFALEDKCPHRLAPLSFGEQIDGNLRCGYHGALFDGTGRCLSVPGQNVVPAGIRARAYPVQEKYGLVWVWPGDPALSADERSIPDSVLKYGVSPYVCRNGQMLSFNADCNLIIDNLLDVSHAEFVHRASLSSPDWQIAKDTKTTKARRGNNQFSFDIREDGIDFTFLLRDAHPGACFFRIYGMKLGRERYDEPLDLDLYVHWTPPGLFAYVSVLKPAGGNEDSALDLANLHILTPETEYTSHYFFRCCVRGTDRGEKIVEEWFDVLRKTFLEDKRVIEAQQSVIGRRDLFEHSLNHFDSDLLQLRGRDILTRMHARERENLSAFA